MRIAIKNLPFRHCLATLARDTSPKQGEAYSHNPLITGSEKQARQGERGFVRRERTQKYVTKAKRKFNTVLRCLYEAARSFIYV